MNYYNENDPKAAAWLRELIRAGHIGAGDVDERSIVDVQPREIEDYHQQHFFAGIGGWPLALRMAGWPDRKRAITGSCPCQPFSSASRGRGGRIGDARDLWPTWLPFLSSRTRVVFGEQIAQADDWHDRARDDMERMGYAFGAAILPACCVGQDHIRYRFYFVGHPNREGESGVPQYEEVGGLPRDRSEPEILVPADGFPDRMALMRGFGNAIVPALAAEFIRAYQEAISVS